MDTNVWLERLLEQERSGEVREFLNQTPSGLLYITDFALHSIGLILARLGQLEGFGRFVKDLLTEGGVTLIRLGPEDLIELINVVQRFSLDFDDAYQYVGSAKHDLTLVSFDSDFDRTELGWKSPAQLLQ